MVQGRQTGRSNGKQGDQHDGVIQINGYFYFIFNLQWTKNKKEVQPCRFHVSTKEKKKRKKRSKTTSQRWLRSQIIGLRKGKRKIYINVNPFLEEFSCTSMHLCAQCVWYVPLSFDRATWSQTRPPSLLPSDRQTSETGCPKACV